MSGHRGRRQSKIGSDLFDLTRESALMQFVGTGLELARRLHALVQNARDLDQPGFGDAVVDHMDRPLDARLSRVLAHMPQMKAAQIGPEIGRGRVNRPSGSLATWRIARIRVMP